VLHVIRINNDTLAQGVIEKIRRDDVVEQTLLLIHDAVYMRLQEPRVFACSDDVRARGIETDASLVEYGEIVDMIFEHDKVMTW
jgi:sulfur relay protein TusB/DsrH